MNNQVRPKFIAVFLVLLALVMGLIWLLRPREYAKKSANNIVERTSNQISNRSTAPIQPQSRALTDSSASGKTNDTEAEYMRWFLEEVRKDPRIEGRFPINFWGKVVDENNQPVAGAKVKFSWSDLSPTGTSEQKTTSDANGLFSLLNQKGKRLYVWVEKKGYYNFLNSTRKDFEYAAPYERFHPDQNSPVVFQLRKTGVWEPLIHRGGLVQLHDQHSRLLLNFDNILDKQNGQLEIKIERGTKRETEQHFDWSFSVIVPTGGAILSKDEFPASAPEEGYQPECKLEWKASDADWQYMISPKFYFKFGSPARYGRIQITRYGANDDWMQLQYWVNPRGSRNLEADPVKPPDSPP
jgi:hypothetical protein